GEKYLGIGPSAHSYNGIQRRWNPSSNQLYLRQQNNGGLTREHEELSATQTLNEYIMISLRTIEGIDLKRIEKEWGAEEKNRIFKQLEKFTIRNLIFIANEHIQLTNEGMLMADGIASDLFTVGKVDKEKS
ncbi:MAG: coproporphyrinogen III oxidase, partial [Flavisolibacter sp.]